MTEELGAILDHIAVLSSVPTGHIAPTAQVLNLQNVMREDGLCHRCRLKRFWANAPEGLPIASASVRCSVNGPARMPLYAMTIDEATEHMEHRDFTSVELTESVLNALMILRNGWLPISRCSQTEHWLRPKRLIAAEHAVRMVPPRDTDRTQGLLCLAGERTTAASQDP